MRAGYTSPETSCIQRNIMRRKKGLCGEMRQYEEKLTISGEYQGRGERGGTKKCKKKYR